MPSAFADENKILNRTVKVKLYDNTTINYGSGVILESKQDHSIIVTCNHIIDDVDNDCKIVIEKNNKNYLASIVRQNKNADIMVLKTNKLSGFSRVDIVPIKSLKKKQEVYISGCDFGNNPQVWTTKVSELNSFIGPQNLCVKNCPNQGRSGGPVFTKNLELIGICSGINPLSDSGLYFGVYNLIDE